MKNIISILLLFIGFFASAQNIQYLGTIDNIVKVRRGLSIDSILTMPKDTLLAADGSLAVKNGCLYMKNGAFWRKVFCDTTGTTPALIASSQPGSLTKFVGDTATFSVTASGGNPPYIYQWQNVTSNISGATSPSYSINGVGLTDSGNYRVRITDAVSLSTFSNYAHLTVNRRPIAFSVQPRNDTIPNGTTYNLTATVINWLANFKAKWYKNDTLVLTQDLLNSGSLSASFTPSDSDRFKIIVKNIAGDSAISNVATIRTVATVPVVYGWSATDPFVNYVTAPSISNANTIYVPHNADLSIYFPSTAVNKFLVFKVPFTESIKNTWYSNSANNGVIGDGVFRSAWIVGGFVYYVSRDPAGVAFDYTIPFQLKQ